MHATFEIISGAELEWNAAMVAADYDAVEKLMSPSFTYTSFGGQVLSKAAFLQQLRAGQRRVSEARIDELKVSLLPGCSVVSGLLCLKGVFAGIPYQGATRYTKVWVLSESSWQAACFHTTDVRQISRWEELSSRYRRADQG